MKKLLLSFIFLTALSSLLISQVVLKEPLSPRYTYYNIEASLDPAAKKVYGSMFAYWVNMSDDVVSNVMLHMYLNAFRNRKSTFYMESSGIFLLIDSGYVEITQITDGSGSDLTGSMKYVRPDDGNPYDMTVLDIALPQSCKPGDTVKLSIDFISKLPKGGARTGYDDDYFFVAQWFPKFGVYEPAGIRYGEKGGWNCHQFHRHSEFYSNHSAYDVRITVPSGYVVGSGGMLVDEIAASDTSKTLYYRAEDIVDFAWTAWPGYSVHNDKWNHVDITFLYPPSRKNQVSRQVAAVKNALEYLNDNMGPYPWPHLTFVDPPSKGAFSGGMEYTTLFTSASFYGAPEYLRWPEMVTIHEFGHAYFMGILASNEFEEPWLDEGVNTYWEGRIVDAYYGKNSGLLDHKLLKISDKSYSRMSYIYSDRRQAATNAENSWSYPDGTYGIMSYNKAGIILHTLEGIIGEESMNEIFREYYRKWAFRHPSARDFINTANSVIAGSPGNKYGPDLNWFFNQTFYGTEICDYKVLNLSNKKKKLSDSTYNSTVEVLREGGLMLPVEIQVHFDDGTEVLEKWDGVGRIRQFNYDTSKKVEWVRIDPGYKIMLDVNFINNSMTTDPDRVPLRRMRNKLVFFIQIFLSIIYL